MLCLGTGAPRVAIIIVLSRDVTSGDEGHGEMEKERERKGERDKNNARKRQIFFFHGDHYEDKLMAR